MTKNGIVPALDSNLGKALDLVQNLEVVSKYIKGYKIGSLLVYDEGLKRTVEAIKEKTKIPIIFDAQKGSTDIPEIVYSQVKMASKAGISEIIAAPQGSGPKSLEYFVKSCEDNGVIPICVIEMTHPLSQKYLKESANEEILKDSLELGIRKFVIPATKKNRVEHYVNLIADFGFTKDTILMTTGINVQGGKLSEMRKLGVNQYIMGRSLLNSPSPQEVVLDSYKDIE